LAKFFSWILIIPLGAVVVAFTISNRDKVIIDFWPVPISFETPIFAVVLIAVFIGFLLGGLVSFFSAGRRIFLNWHLSKALDNAKREEVILKKELRKFEEGSADSSARSKTKLEI